MNSAWRMYDASFRMFERKDPLPDVWDKDAKKRPELQRAFNPEKKQRTHKGPAEVILYYLPIELWEEILKFTWDPMSFQSLSALLRNGKKWDDWKTPEIRGLFFIRQNPALRNNSQIIHWEVQSEMLDAWLENPEVATRSALESMQNTNLDLKKVAMTIFGHCLSHQHLAKRWCTYLSEKRDFQDVWHCPFGLARQIVSQETAETLLRNTVIQAPYQQDIHNLLRIIAGYVSSKSISESFTNQMLQTTRPMSAQIQRMYREAQGENFFQ